MSDKLQKGLLVTPTFSNGEVVRAGKLTALARQSERALSNLEKAVGDIYAESYPYSSSHDTGLSIVWGTASTLNVDDELEVTSLINGPRHLDIASLGRLIGSSANLNPHFPEEEVEVTQIVPVGVYAFKLKYPLKSIVSSTDSAIDEVVTLTGSDSLPAIPANRYGYISRTNEIVTNTATSGGTITYVTDPKEYAGGSNYLGASFNVIPDPIQIQEGGEGCEVSASLDSEGRHTVTLPLLTHMAKNESGTDVLLGVIDPGKDHQLVLPRVLTESYSAGELIPNGFLYLKNVTTGQTYRDASYYYIDGTSLHVAELDLESEVADGNKFAIVTIGTDITTSIDDLRLKFKSHGHSGEFGEELVEARHISGWTRLEGVSGKFTPSKLDGNYAPQYLHRDGKQADATLNDDNAMRGDIYFGRTGGSAGFYLDYGLFTGETFGVYFGSEDWGVYRDSSADLIIKARTSSDIVVKQAEKLIVKSGIQKDAVNTGSISYVEDTNCLGVSGIGSGGDSTVRAGFIFSSSAAGIGAHRTTSIFDGLFVGPVVDANENGIALSPWIKDRHAGWWDDGVEADGFSTFNRVSGGTPYSSGSSIDSLATFWKVPKINIIHYAIERHRVIFYDGSGGISGSWSGSDWAQMEIALPSWIEPSDILAISVLVRRDSEEPWCGLGSLWNEGIGQPLRSIGVKIATGNILKIHIPTDGVTEGNPFHYELWRNGEAYANDPHSSNYDMADVKVTLTVAGQTRSGIGQVTE